MLQWLQSTWQTVYGVISNTVLTAFPLIHTILLIMAGCFGSMLYGKLKPALKDAFLRALGIFVILMGASQLWDSFFILQTAQFETTGTILVVVSLVAGYALGHAFALDRALGRFGVWLCRRFIKDKPRRTLKELKAMQENPDALPPKQETVLSAEGFLLATLLCAFSAPTIRSTLDSRTSEDALPLLVTLGFGIVVLFVLTAVYGISPVFGAIPVLAVEGILFLSYTLCGDLLTNALVNQFCLIGAVILIATGLGLGLGKRIRAANFIPAYLIPVVYGLVMLLVNKLVEAA